MIHYFTNTSVTYFNLLTYFNNNSFMLVEIDE
jgi:hypothetical protein